MYQLILEYVRQQVKIKIDQARGVFAPTESSNKSKKLTLQERLSKPKRVLEQYDFRSVLRFMVIQILQGSGNLRAGLLCAFNYFLLMTAPELDRDDFEWSLIFVLDIMKDPAVLAFSSEETLFFRARLEFILHSVSSNIGEAQQLRTVAVICRYLSTMDQHSDQSLHLALCEMGNLVASLDENAAAVANLVQGVATIHLHSPSFALRTQAAHLLASLSLSVPLIAADILRLSLSNAKLSVTQITSTDFEEKVVAINGLTLKNPTSAKLLDKMFFFHGHTLVLSIILKNEKSLPIGLSSSFIFEIFDFGMELMRYDVISAPVDIRQLICNFVRAGSLLVSACVSIGANVVAMRLPMLTQCCEDLISKASVLQPSSLEATGNSDDMLFNMMIIESSVFALSSVLWYCPEEVTTSSSGLQGQYLACINKAFTTMEEQYSIKFKTHYRYRTLQVNIVECYAMLPPNLCSVAMFSSAFNTFRSFTLAGVESDLFGKLAESKRVFEILTTEGVARPQSNRTTWKALGADLLMQRLESNAYALHTKESEASVGVFKNKFHYSYEKEINIKEYSPCVRMESRSVDASAAVLAIVFARESQENKDRLVEFCADAISQVLSTIGQGSNNLFASEDEKKRKFRVNLTILKNSIYVLYSIVSQFPFHAGVSAYDISLSWIHTIANSMISLLSYNDFDIRVTASYTISLLIFKVSDFDITESIARKVLGYINVANDSQPTSSNNKTDWNLFCGHFIVLSNMWTSVEKRFITKEDITKVFIPYRRIFFHMSHYDNSFLISRRYLRH